MNFWTYVYRFSWIVLGILALILGASLFLPQLRQYQELQRRKAAIEEEIRLEQQLLAHLKRQQERLRRDPRFVERIAREEFGLAKPGETIFRFLDAENGTEPGR